MDRYWEELDLPGTGRLYGDVPRRAFRWLTSINLASTQLSNRHFQQMMLTVSNLQRLDISNCPRLNQIAIFQAKEYLHELQHITISGNKQFTVLTMACLCSCLELETIKVQRRIVISFKNFRVSWKRWITDRN